MRNNVVEWSYTSTKKHADPFNEVELSAIITLPGGEERILPAFWSGDDTWTLRYSSNMTGRHSFRTVCSDNSDMGLHCREGAIEVTEYDGVNPLMVHGGLKVTDDGRHFAHLDGKPFFWLGDTWWMSLCKRLEWPDEFKRLAEDRVKKGFSVIQVVAGLYPDMPPFDERGANEAGYPWDKDFKTINPSYFDMADIRITWLVRCGLVPCIVACWGYFLEFAGPDTLKKHWRYLIARYGAYPVVWCLAGEALMPFYGHYGWPEDKNRRYVEMRVEGERRKEYMEWAREGWSGIAEYVRSTDPYKRLLTVHPIDFGHKMVESPSLIDFDMLQPGHEEWKTMEHMGDMMDEAVNRSPAMPVINSETCYEGILAINGANIQRHAFWTCMLSGAAGHTYGANGIWQVNRKNAYYGKSPVGTSWGNTPWDEAMDLPGSKQTGLGKSFLERYRWWEFEPRPDWAEPHACKGNRLSVYAAGIPGEVRVYYIPVCFSGYASSFKLTNLEKDIIYRAYIFEPSTGYEYDLGNVEAQEDGTWRAPGDFLPVRADLVLVLERKNSF